MPDPGDSGLNLHAIIDVAALPDSIRVPLLEAAGDESYRQLHLFGHAGPCMWQALQASDYVTDADPVDAYSAAVVADWFAGQGVRHRLLFPFGQPRLPLQALGELAGWHHRSPFMVGVNGQWGSWYAYRAVALADSAMPATPKAEWPDVCASCIDKPCVAACPAGALVDEASRLTRCIDYRLQEASPCSHQCLARNACPVGAAHRYSDAQIRYHYGRSLATIRAWREQAD
jgi:hypothetical protein